jgi:predicted acylesterase/phospholipase RssA
LTASWQSLYSISTSCESRRIARRLKGVAMIFDMVFEGGGAKGFSFVGALDQFLGRGHAVDRLLGTSAGSIAATLLAAGYSMPELLAALAERKDGKSVFAASGPERLEADLFKYGGLRGAGRSHPFSQQDRVCVGSAVPGRQASRTTSG